MGEPLRQPARGDDPPAKSVEDGDEPPASQGGPMSPERDCLPPVAGPSVTLRQITSAAIVDYRLSDPERD